MSYLVSVLQELLGWTPAPRNLLVSNTHNPLSLKSSKVNVRSPLTSDKWERGISFNLINDLPINDDSMSTICYTEKNY